MRGLLVEAATRAADRFLAGTNLYERVFFFSPVEINHVNYIELSLPGRLSRPTEQAIEEVLYRGRVRLFGRYRDAGEYEEKYGRSFSGAKWWRIKAGCPYDVKYCWEINRHQHLPLLGMACSYEKYSAAAEKYIRGYLTRWMAENPPECGLNWASGLEIALRSVSWCLAFWLAKPGLGGFWQDFLKMLYYHGVHLERHIPYTKACMPNNHLLGETTALVLLGLLFGNRKWIGFRSRLERLAKKQFYNDGMNFEQSIGYHKFSLQFLSLAMAILQRFELPLDKAVVKRIKNAVLFLKWVTKPDGSLPNIGDNDNGSVFNLPEELKSLLNLEDQAEGINRGDTGRSFPAGGFYVWRSDSSGEGNFLLVKAGPHKNHAHADLLHFEYSFKGENIFVDSGTYQYADPGYRRYFRSTAAHNTLAVNGRDQSIQYRTFRWLWAAKAKGIEFSEASPGLSFIFAGTVHYPGGVFKHRRVIKAVPGLDMIELNDYFRGRTATACFHLNPGIEASMHGSGNAIMLTTPQKRNLLVYFTGPHILSIKLDWLPFSAMYGELGRHPCIFVHLAGGGRNICLKTVIKPLPFIN